MSEERTDLPDVWVQWNAYPRRGQYPSVVELNTDDFDLSLGDPDHYIPAARVQRMSDENAKVAGLVEALELARDSVEAVYRHHRERFGSDDPATRTMAKKLTTVQRALAACREGSK